MHENYLLVTARISGALLFPVIGREPFCRPITRHGPASSVTIEHVISHGKAGAVNGVVEFGRKQRAFCYVFEFSNAKGTAVKAITAYSIPLADVDSSRRQTQRVGTATP